MDRMIEVQRDAERPHVTETQSSIPANAAAAASMRATRNKYLNLLPSIGDGVPSRPSGAVAIIGSTGFLGPYIVASLLQTIPNVPIFCLNRTDDGESRTKTAVQDITTSSPVDLSRLQFCRADITKTDFGLSPPQVALLASQVDEVVFSAWDSNWVKPLHHFDPFLKGILNAVAFCISSPRRVRITFISSICAVGNWPLAHPTLRKIPEEIVSDDRYAMPHGYGQSKHIAEQLLAGASEHMGVPVNVIRAGQIGGVSSCRTGLWPRQGWLYLIIVTSSKLKCFPAGIQPLDWIPVDSLADGVANSIRQRCGAAEIKVFNVVHPQPATWGTLHETLQHRFGLDARQVSLSHWLEQIPTGQMKLRGFLSALAGGREHNMAFENKKARDILPPVQPITEKTLALWLSSWQLGGGSATARL